MPNKHPQMKLSPEEERFLRHWIYDEAHYLEGIGSAKQLQLRHKAKPAELAVLIAAALPDAEEQFAAGYGPAPTQPATWPWSEASFQTRLTEAKATLHP